MFNMAEIIEQKDIDDLLNSAIGEDLTTEAESSDVGGLAGEGTPVSTGTQKIFKPPKKDTSGFKYHYRSPVIKKDRIIYNPRVDVNSTNDKIVVRSLGNYAQYLRNKKKQKEHSAIY